MKLHGFFLDIIVDEHDFEEQLCVMASSLIDLNVTKERSNYPKPSLEDEKCNYYEEFDKPVDLYVAFSSVMVRLYLNFVLNCLFELHLTLAFEKTLIQIVYMYACGIMYDFFGETNYLFAYDFLKNFPEEYHLSHCYGISKDNNEMSEMSI